MLFFFFLAYNDGAKGGTRDVRKGPVSQSSRIGRENMRTSICVVNGTSEQDTKMGGGKSLPEVKWILVVGGHR